MATNFTMSVPTFLEGSSPKSVMEKYLEMTMKTGKEHKIISIYQSGKKHYIWYYVQVPFIGVPKNE